jgi:hypothetical protein
VTTTQPAPSRARIVLWATLAVVLLAAAAVVVGVGVFGRGGEVTGAAPTTTLDQVARMDRLRAEAIQAAETYFPRKDAAESAGDPSLLDGIFVPGSELQAAIAKKINDYKARGEILETTSRTEDVEILTLDHSRAQVRVVNILTSSVRRDIKTRQIKERYKLGKGTWLLYLARVDGRWLVDGLEGVRSSP